MPMAKMSFRTAQQLNTQQLVGIARAVIHRPALVQVACSSSAGNHLRLDRSLIGGEPLGFKAVSRIYLLAKPPNPAVSTLSRKATIGFTLAARLAGT